MTGEYRHVRTVGNAGRTVRYGSAVRSPSGRVRGAAARGVARYLF